MADSTSQRSDKGTGWLVGGGILAVGLLAFIFQNRQTVSFDWLFWTF